MVGDVEQTSTADGISFSFPSDNLIVVNFELMVGDFSIQVGFCNCKNVKPAYIQQHFHLVDLMSV